MIPLSLGLSNFLSYRELTPPLDFERLEIACLSGRNGEGKSALFDGITWALWGRARGVDERGTGTDELITEGQSQMQADLMFELEQNTYRVIRSRNKKKQLTRLEFQIKSNGQFTPLTGNSIRETQDKINHILRLDYRTFVNSAFILQGKADSFLNLKATERKEILAEILNLNIYDRLEVAAREMKRELEKQRDAQQAEADLLEQETGREAEYQSELEHIEQELVTIRKDLLREEKKLDRLKIEQTKMDGQRKLLRELDDRISQHTKELDRLTDELRENEANQERISSYLKRADEIVKGHRQLQELREQEEVLAKKASRFRELQEDLRTSETRIASTQSQLETEISNLNKRHAELAEEDQTEQSLKTRRDELQKAVRELAEKEKERDGLRKTYQDGQTELAGLKAARERCLEKIGSAGEKLLMLEKELKPNCPLCEQELGVHNRERLIADFKREIETEKKELERTEAQLDELTKRLADLEAEGHRLSEEIESNQGVKTSIGEIDTRLRVIKDNHQKLLEIEARLKEQAALLANNKFAPEAFRKKERLIKELNTLSFDPEAYEAVRSRIKDRQFLEEEKVRLTQAKAEQKKLAQAAERLRTYLAEREKLLSEDRSKAEKIRGSIDQSKLKASDLFDGALRESEAECRAVKKQEEERQDRRAVLIENLKRCQSARKRSAVISSEQARVLKEMTIYTDLAVAFGKKGIQALIIENAVPEIEEEANKLLSRLTDGKMRLSFITQKSQKTGGLVETLDLTVSDEQGLTRKYELFSGGESFRINFAVRIALSKLLAKRAGARLETLVIDEGFGTQDNEGKEKLIESISAIKGDFKKILVITHLDELKEMFPARIEVSKEPGIGSTVTIV